MTGMLGNLTQFLLNEFSEEDIWWRQTRNSGTNEVRGAMYRACDLEIVSEPMMKRKSIHTAIKDDQFRE